MNNSDQKRHKCHYCGAVRYEHLMIKITPWKTRASSQFGNDTKCWACRRECWNREKIRERPANLS